MTIVVLIILATISINAVLGDNGIIAKAQQAKGVYENSVLSEEEEMNTLLAEYENMMAERAEPTMPNGWDATKVTAVISDDNVTVPVPIGYTPSTIEGEKRVDTGFVIKEGNNGAATEGINEFVWVPVDNISDLYDSTNNAGQLWDFSGTTSTKRTYPTTQNSGLREPDVLTGASEGSDSSSGSSYDAVSTNLQEAGLSSTATASDFKTQLQNEFTAMKNSVEKYGGFYIGRYETGNLSQSTAVVQRNNTDIGSQTWYRQYKLCKTIKTNDNVVSTMIWGCQWDATMRWMQTNSNSEVVTYVVDSTGKGNYKTKITSISMEVKENVRELNYFTQYRIIETAGSSDSESDAIVIPTGLNPSYAVNNIYDMAGNVYDWTLETQNIYYRLSRGGSVSRYGDEYPVNQTFPIYPTSSDSTYGSRATLYIAL